MFQPTVESEIKQSRGPPSPQRPLGAAQVGPEAQEMRPPPLDIVEVGCSLACPRTATRAVRAAECGSITRRGRSRATCVLPRENET
jgi:hypothetical protein